ncbi:hypothetical protein AVEN_129264-1 [Araneus ventricosus]|uniref:Uncharacterized protein n=1 Tax=Araneus ventricosus TaxID=182803 RepID=A0A4Y2HM76_ARAVE|nr:hypothetical protein AVEN_129264-1 [Araneus ventricosus]
MTDILIRSLSTGQKSAAYLYILVVLGTAGENGSLMVRSRLWSRRDPGSKSDSTEELSCIGPAARQIVRKGPNVIPLVWCESLEEGTQARVSSYSSNRGSKLRYQSRNSPRVASKRDDI